MANLHGYAMWLGTGNTCLLLARTHLRGFLAARSFQSQPNSPEVITIWTISACVTNCWRLTILKHFVGLNHYMVTRGFPGYCPEVLWKRSFANFKFIGIPMHKIPYFCIFIVMERIYLTLQSEMCISRSLFLKSTINKIDHKGFKCQYNIFRFEFWGSFSTFYRSREQNPHI